MIGFFRPDGTAKPELRVVPEYAAFFAAAAPWLDDFEPDPVVAVIPHSRLLMNRPGGADGLKRMIRVLAERFGVVPTGLSELRLTAERLRHAKLILVPSPLVLEDGAAAALLEASRAGAKVLVTGVVLGNPYGEISEPLERLGIVDPGQAGEPARGHELGRERRGLGHVRPRPARAARRGAGPALKALTGNVWHEPLPLEFAREDEPLAALLQAALAAAGVETQPSETAVAARLLYAPRAVLAVVVNETAALRGGRLTVEGRSLRGAGGRGPVAAGSVRARHRAGAGGDGRRADRGGRRGGDAEL